MHDDKKHQVYYSDCVFHRSWLDPNHLACCLPLPTIQMTRRLPTKNSELRAAFMMGVIRALGGPLAPEDYTKWYTHAIREYPSEATPKVKTIRKHLSTDRSQAQGLVTNKRVFANESNEPLDVMDIS